MPFAARVRRVGLLIPASADDGENQIWVGAFLQGLQQAGWTIGRNLRIDARWGGTDIDLIRKHATELAVLAPDVILAHGNGPVSALRQVTRTIPIVFPVAGDPVGTGLVDSLARPGGNTTGFAQFEFSIQAENGWSCSSRSRRMQPERRSFVIQVWEPVPVNSPPSRPWRLHSAST